MKKKFLGNYLKSLRRNNKLTIIELESLLKKINFPISVKTIYKWESNEALPDLNVLNALSTIYNVSISTFLEEDSTCQSLNETELELITYLRTNIDFKKIISLITKVDKEEQKNGNKIVY